MEISLVLVLVHAVFFSLLARDALFLHETETETLQCQHLRKRNSYFVWKGGEKQSCYANPRVAKMHFTAQCRYLPPVRYKRKCQLGPGDACTQTLTSIPVTAASRDALSGHLLFLFSLLYAPCVFLFIILVLFPPYEQHGGGGVLPDFLFSFLFSLFSRPRAGLATMLSNSLGLAINTLNVRNSNNNNSSETGLIL